MTNANDPTVPRRDLLRMAALGALPPARWRRDRACILIRQEGGASQLDTFDLKPRAPRAIRGVFGEIPTSVPGIRISEHLPLTARQAHRFAILRSMRSGETNHERAAAYVRAGYPAAELAGAASLERQCLLARRRIEAGAPFVSVRQPGYDTHADNFRKLKDELLPEFDRAFAGLLVDLDECGLLDTTLVIVTGEFGRTPRINPRGGRDHHSRAWSVVLAGAGVPGGHVVGATDTFGEEVIDSPVRPEDLARTVHEILGVQPPPHYLASGGRLVRELLA
ncbi:MAG: DUF1501 domain-containing protein [Acidobacteriota bacterium]